ncbi:unnamed protein product, partial [Rangifer tarandus platyrhynchus]
SIITFYLLKLNIYIPCNFYIQINPYIYIYIYIYIYLHQDMCKIFHNSFTCCFHVLAIINSAAMKIGIHVSLSDLVSLV